jgi:phospholipase D1/2
MPLVPLRPAPVRDSSPERAGERPRPWIRMLALIVFLGLLAAAWQWTPLKELADLDRLSAWIEPHQGSWYAPPLVVAAYVLLGLIMFPVLLMILATGIAFGPWLGMLYALAGCLASGSVGFLLGRAAGRERVERFGGDRLGRLIRTLKRNGILAVFVARKVPAPYTISNVVVGASGVRYRDFVLGTTLGMGPMIVALAGFGSQLREVVKDPTPAKVAVAVAFLTVPLGLALLLNRLLKRGRNDA